MSQAEYATIQHSLPLQRALPPGELTFTPGDISVAREDTKLLYNKNVYSFELESNIITALKNIIMAKLETASYAVLKQQYVGYPGRSVWVFINHLLTAYGEKTDDMVKANLKALTEEFNCSGASIEQL